MQLSKLLQNITKEKIPSDVAHYDIRNVCSDSRKVIPNSLFIALKGFSQNGEDFIPDAVKKGAVAVIKSPSGSQSKSLTSRLPKDPNVFILEVEDTNKTLREIAAKFYDHPSSKVRTIGVTGTNGKTTTTFVIESILQKAGQACGVLGTINYRINREVFPAPNTTPDVIGIQQFLYNLMQKNIPYCVMEVSSHGLDQGRVDLIDFKVGLFTNLTSDHLDYHQTTEKYFLAKAKLFQNLSKGSHAIINGDDPLAKQLKAMTKAKVYTFGVSSDSDFKAVDITTDISHTSFQIKCPQGKMINIRSKLIGLHNIYNILGAVAACYAEKIPISSIEKGVEELAMVPGRLEKINCGQDFHVFIDYAHTEDGLKNVLSCLQDIKTRKLIVVFGCGGNRDKTKRPKMGKVASQLAEIVILTSDNPRTEDPQDIIDEIIVGCSKENYAVSAERKEAIYYALHLAQKDDVVLIAGKGHEDYQIFKNQTIHFNDKEVIQEFFAARKLVNKA